MFHWGPSPGLVFMSIKVDSNLRINKDICKSHAQHILVSELSNVQFYNSSNEKINSATHSKYALKEGSYGIVEKKEQGILSYPI